MSECAVQTGILFSRVHCGEPAALHCGRCKIPLCKKHLVVQKAGPILCPQCNRYENDDDHDWEYSDDSGWHWRGASGAGASAGLDDDDADEFATDARATGAADADGDAKENDFDAS